MPISEGRNESVECDGEPSQRGIRESWISVGAAAQYLGVTQVTVRRWIKDRGLPHVKIGGRIRLKAGHIDEWATGNA